jgi:ABC-type polysaccharide/polyol phosphate transport system ATPase subunit
VIASHSDDMIRRLCNKAALLDEGRLCMVGPVDQVLSAYRRLA